MSVGDSRRALGLIGCHCTILIGLKAANKHRFEKKHFERSSLRHCFSIFLEQPHTTNAIVIQLKDILSSFKKIKYLKIYGQYLKLYYQIDTTPINNMYEYQVTSTNRQRKTGKEKLIFRFYK